MFQKLSQKINPAFTAFPAKMRISLPSPAARTSVWKAIGIVIRLGLSRSHCWHVQWFLHLPPYVASQKFIKMSIAESKNPVYVCMYMCILYMKYIYNIIYMVHSTNDRPESVEMLGALPNICKMRGNGCQKRTKPRPPACVAAPDVAPWQLGRVPSSKSRWES